VACLTYVFFCWNLYILIDLYKYFDVDLFVGAFFFSCIGG
jgi:hypothetical protein